MFHQQLQILSFLSFFFLNLTVGGNFPSPSSPVYVDFNNFHVATPNSLLSAVRLPNFESPFRRVNIIATAAIILITLLNIIVYKLRQLHEANFGAPQQLEEANLGQKPSIQSPLASEQPLRRFSLPEIISAAHNFDDSKVIGKGGFGKVYKGVIDNGAVAVAIKRLNHMSKQGAVEFHTEIEMLSKFRHRNLISLIGYCNDCDEMILIYEYMNCGALADHLYKIERTGNNSSLSWVQRLKICIGAARGLEYLHTGTNVIHRDLKSSNILLDENLTAKVSDFGISKIGSTNKSCSHVSTKIKGTRGYVDPEYLLTHKLTRKSDVYSFGVVLFEVLSGRPVVDLTRPEEQWGLVFWAQHCIKEETINKIVDPSLSCQILPNSLASFVKIANHCLHYRSKKRPAMAEVVASLECALALQERTDSSVFDRDLLSMGGNFGNQDIVDCSSEQPQIIHSGSVQHQDDQIDKTAEQEIVDYSSKQHEVVHSGNGQHKYKSYADESNGNSRMKTTRITAFIKTVRQVFGDKPQMSTGFSNSVRKKKKKKPLISDVSRSQELLTHFPGQDELFSFSFNVVKIATESFAPKNKLGQGGFGSIYKGTLPGGQEIAVKRLANGSRQGLEEFKNEVILIAKLQHRNLVRLLGWCIEVEENLLIYEYVPNKSLDSFLFDPVMKAQLDRRKRLTIIKGIARGLLYLHQDSRDRMIHRDLKASNILLDEEMNPKISDFGLARIFEGNQYEMNTFRVVGTYGYMAPEYAIEGIFSVKSDVYSFGALLLEIVRGQKNSSYWTDEHRDLSRYAWKLWSDGKAVELIDPSIADSCPRNQVLQCVHVAMLCLQESAIHRPTMLAVLLMLESENATSFPSPILPNIYAKSYEDTDSFIHSDYTNVSPNDVMVTGNCIMSSNDITVTEVDGR